MALRDDMNAGLAELAKTVKFSVPQPDNAGNCRLEVPVPAALIELHENQLLIDIRLAPDGSGFTLSSPVALIQTMPRATFWETLLRQQYVHTPLSIAIADMGEQDVLMGMQRWPVDSITPAQFTKLYGRYLPATFDLIDRVNQMSAQSAGVRPLHKGRG